MKLVRLLICLALVVVFAVSVVMNSPIAKAARKASARLEYSVVVDRFSSLTYVFARKGNSGWNIVGAQVCSVGNPFAETPKGTYVVTRKKKTLSFAGNNYRYLTFTNRPRVTFVAMPSQNRDNPFYGTLGEPCTMGEVWLAQKWAKWIYNKIPVGTKVYIF